MEEVAIKAIFCTLDARREIRYFQIGTPPTYARLQRQVTKHFSELKDYAEGLSFYWKGWQIIKMGWLV